MPKPNSKTRKLNLKLQIQQENILSSNTNCTIQFQMHNVYLYSMYYVLYHRPLHTYMDINENFEDYHRRLTFPELIVTKLVVTQGTTRYQMKDMNIIFPLTPHTFLQVKWFGNYSHLKSSIFSKCSKLLEIDHFLKAVKLDFLVTFFQKAIIQ